jgi:ribosomal protein S18 acetylase RimI-like enzyme
MDKPDTQAPLRLKDLTIRQVTKDDLPDLEWEGEYTKYRRMYASLFRDTQSGKTMMWIITLPGSEIIGQVFVMLKSVEWDAADGESRAYIFAFRIKSPWRNQGVGSYLMAFVEQDLHHRGYKFVTLNVAKDNHEALRLYQRLGYKITGSRSGVWSYRDHEGNLQHVNEPSWRMMKRLPET